jgi:hypothetical protein
VDFNKRESICSVNRGGERREEGRRPRWVVGGEISFYFPFHMYNWMMRINLICICIGIMGDKPVLLLSTLKTKLAII